ncbi:MAG: hypothetical protein AAGF77_10565 [Bacteroidota bacterium]
MNIRIICLALTVIVLISKMHAQEAEAETWGHQDPTHNFSMQRLIVLNENNEMLMVRESYVWVPPALLYDKQEYVLENLQRLAKDYGIETTSPELRGLFAFKYDYHPYASLRNYYVAQYVQGTIEVPKGMDEVVWMPIPEAIEKITVTAIKEITEQLLEFPDVVWGGSFMVSRTDNGHPTQQTVSFYPLFRRP